MLMKRLSWAVLSVASWLSMAAAGAMAKTATPRDAAAPVPGALRLPYRDGEVYRVNLVPGTPFVVELPSGETVDNVWRDAEYWHAEWVEGGTRVVIRAIASSDIGRRKSFVHIETASGLRISLRVQAVGPNEEVPGSLKVYLDGPAAAEPMKQQVQQKVNAELVFAKRAAEQEARAKFEAWKKAALSNMRSDYEFGGDFTITRVVDNRLQTFISVPDGSDKGVIQFVDKSGKAEMINSEFSNGVYTTENKVLQRGEKFRIILGKEKAWVGLK
jgi:hypothetical protein